MSTGDIENQHEQSHHMLTKGRERHDTNLNECPEDSEENNESIKNGKEDIYLKSAEKLGSPKELSVVLNSPRGDIPEEMAFPPRLSIPEDSKSVITEQTGEARISKKFDADEDLNVSFDLEGSLKIIDKESIDMVSNRTNDKLLDDQNETIIGDELNKTTRTEPYNEKIIIKEVE